MNLQDVLAEHKLWLDTKGNSGKRANLIGVDLIGVDLSGYDLFNTIGDGSYIQTIQTGEGEGL